MRDESNKIAIKRLVDIALLMIIFIIPLTVESAGNISFFCMSSFLINGLLFIIGIYRSNRKHAISMSLIYWVFMFFFMYFAPVIQYITDMYPWRGFVTEGEAIYANMLILLFNLVFMFSCWGASKIKFVSVSKHNFTEWLCNGVEFKKKSSVFLSLIVVVITLYSLSKTGLSGIIVSRLEATQVFYSGNNSAIALVVESVVPAFVAYVVAEAAQKVVSKKENGVRFILLFICLLICFFPTVIPRYKVAVIYGVIFVTLFQKINKGSRFLWIFILGLFFVFPAMHAVRNVILLENIQVVIGEEFFESYTDGNYDAWRMIVSAIRYTEVYNVTFGRQLFGVLLFFVPSSMWSSKPIGSGALLIMTELGNNVFSNCSCPYIAEGFVNFGVVGVILFAVFLGFFVTKLDERFWNNLKSNNQKPVFSPYLFLVFMLFFIMRGDLLSGFAYICGFIVTGFILRPFSKRM